MTDHRLRDAAVAHSAATLALVDVLRKARGVQWEAPPGTSTLGSQIGPKGERLNDPTAAFAIDGRRLRLRAHVENGLHRLKEATAALVEATESLEASLAPYAVKPAPYWRPQP